MGEPLHQFQNLCQGAVRGLGGCYCLAAAAQLQPLSSRRAAACKPQTLPLLHTALTHFQQAHSYGGGLAGDTYADPSVRMSHVYLAVRSGPFPGFAMLDNYVFMMTIGFVGLSE